jgi:RNA polymerase sigma-70 factor (ECF subfamily)
MGSRDIPPDDRTKAGFATRDPQVDEFVSLMAVWQRRIFLYVLSLLQNATNAEEVLQETNLALWQKYDQYQPGTSFGSWAYRVAYYEVLKFREKSGRNKQQLLSNECLELLAVEAERVLDEADARREALDNCLKKMQPKHRELLVQRYQPGATTRSVAEALGRSVDGMRQSLRQLRSKLLACIQRTLAAEERP